MRYLLFFFITITTSLNAQYSREDSIKGSITFERAWWDVNQYDLVVDINPEKKFIQGFNTIYFLANEFGDKLMQIDLIAPMKIDSVLFENEKVEFQRTTHTAYYIKLNIEPKQFERHHQISIYFSGVPIEAKNAPWDGGIVWTKDKNGNDFVASAVQGIGASAWWPCKDHWSDEPDLGMKITVTCPENKMGVSNGKMLGKITNNNNRTTTTWEVKNPINAYGVNFNIGDYVHWADTFEGKAGQLPLNFYVLRESEENAKKQFQDVYRMLEAFEHWFGPYPFYEDGYKLVEVPYLGMEHQSSVTYGNGYKNGYLGKDLSDTGWGLKWDFIIIHESGHEWFANNITASDPADMWIHEAFTTYSEGLFTEYFYGKEAGNAYIRGLRKNILNDRPIIGNYDVHNEGSYDMYSKGANILHTIRQIVDNDSLWLEFLRSINKEFRHQIVSSNEVETYMSKKLKFDLSSIFDVYLRSTNIPILEIRQKKRKMLVRWNEQFSNLKMPIIVKRNNEKLHITPTIKYQTIKGRNIEIDLNYLILIRKK